MKDAVAESGKTQFPGRDLEEENITLRAEIERLRRILAANGLTAASAIRNQHNSRLPIIPNSWKIAKNAPNSVSACFEVCFMAEKMFMQNGGPTRMAVQDIRLLR
jgi:hypothetical protein